MSNVQENDRIIDDNGLDILFRKARTQNGWLNKSVSDELIHEIYELTKYGPTSANASPARFLFLKSEAAKERLLPAMAPLNAEKSRTASVIVIIAYDVEFYEKLPKLFPHANAKAWFANNEALAHETAFRNGTLQGAYLMLAARALGLDCGPMSGFDATKVNAEFFADGKWKVNFICNMGYGDESKIFPRNPRLDFDEASQIL